MATQEVPAPIKINPERTRIREVWGTPGLYNSIILGTYQKSCGGCDEFSWKGSHDAMVAAIMWGMRQYRHVIFEGLTVTSSFQRYVSLAEFAEGHGHPSHWVMLNVDLQECIRRVGARNNKVTTSRVIHNVTKKNDTVLSTIVKLKDQFPMELTGGRPLGWSAHTETEAAQTHAHKLLSGL
jgi:hypothetical protein